MFACQYYKNNVFYIKSVNSCVYIEQIVYLANNYEFANYIIY